MINEKIFVEINGINQGMFIKSENLELPVLLFLHGGPGSPEIAFSQKYPIGLEKLFTVCWWEQRGSGITYSSSAPKESMTMENMITDTVAVSKYLCDRFKQNKIYIMGHSWGSLLGMLTVKKHPELYRAYIGIGQISNQDKSERLAYTYMLEEFQKAGNTKMVGKLKKFDIENGVPISLKYLSIRTSGMNQLGIGMFHKVLPMHSMISIILKFKQYTFMEKMNYLKGTMFSIKYLWDKLITINLTEEMKEVGIPVYICHGKYDHQVSYALSKQYIKDIKAPLKGFYTFEKSAHSPNFEEPEKFYEIMEKDVLQSKIDLADK